jgi:hypothetical protein
MIETIQNLDVSDDVRTNVFGANRAALVGQ